MGLLIICASDRIRFAPILEVIQLIIYIAIKHWKIGAILRLCKIVSVIFEIVDKKRALV